MFGYNLNGFGGRTFVPPNSDVNNISSTIFRVFPFLEFREFFSLLFFNFTKEGLILIIVYLRSFNNGLRLNLYSSQRYCLEKEDFLFQLCCLVTGTPVRQLIIIIPSTSLPLPPPLSLNRQGTHFPLSSLSCIT